MARFVLVATVLEVLALCAFVANSQRTVTPEDKRSWEVTITPSSQKVAEGSTVVFTCESSLPTDVRFRWTKPVRPIKEKKDGVEIVDIAHNRSVLRISQAHLGKHRRTFRCTAYYDDPDSQSVLDLSANVVLKVIPRSKLGANFPKITSRIADNIASPALGTIPLICEIDGYWSKSVPTFTWFKDSVIDLSMERDNWANDGMRILYIDPQQSPGQYQCAVFYKKGSVAAYGNVISADVIQNQIKKNCTNYNGTAVRHGVMFYPKPCEFCECVDGESDGRCAIVDCAPIPVGCVPKPGGACCEYSCDDAHSIVNPCTDYKGSRVMDGDIYRPGDEPCETCLCSEGMPTLCSTAACDEPPCRTYIPIPDTCCGFECLDCLSYDGTIFNEGDLYQPTADPCETCTCEKGKPIHCFNVACLKPTLPCPEPIPIPGECCKFTCGALPSDLINFLANKTDCVAYNGSSVASGQSYTPDSDPCKRCTCQNGEPDYCMNVACMPPPMPCDNPRPVPGECCKFTCEITHDVSTLFGKECVAYNGSRVVSGQPYTPDSDPCKTCTCLNGEPLYCMNVACMPPPMPCADPRPVPGVCCKFTCENLEDSLNLVKKDCVAYNGSSVPAGQNYSPDSDPCKICTCKNGGPVYCLSLACNPPAMPCPKPRPVPGECCRFTCDRPVDFTGVEKDCVAYNGSSVVGGMRYTPDKDPCKMCTCQNGRPVLCINVGCARPDNMPCRDPRPVPGECCKFTCEDPVELNHDHKGCMSYNGSMVPFGSMYQPSKDPCKVCECSTGHSMCMMVSCARPPMPCPNPQQLPNECCSFTCNESVPIYNVEKDRYHIDIQIKPYVQQIGPQEVMVQMELPDMEQFEEVTNVTVYVSRKEYLGQFEIDGGMNQVIVRGLNQSQTYRVWTTAIGKLHNPDEMVARMRLDPVELTLNPKATTSLNLRHAIGQVYESRGSVNVGPFSMPRPFQPIVAVDTIHVTMNLNTFNMVEISSYTDRPCPRMECGLLRFYMYNMTGHANNVMSLMFAEDMDFKWAKAHL